MLRRIWFSSLAIVAGLAFSVPAARAADVVIAPPCPGPLVGVRVGDPAQHVVTVNVPGILHLEVGRTRLLRRRLGTPVLVPVAPPPMVPVAPAPAPENELPPPRPVPPGTKATSLPVLTAEDFADTFKPRAGEHEVVLVHPDTGRPVTVHFTLPAGTPKVRVDRREIGFDYGKQEVDIRFLRSGGVRVYYD